MLFRTACNGGLRSPPTYAARQSRPAMAALKQSDLEVGSKTSIECSQESAVTGARQK